MDMPQCVKDVIGKPGKYKFEGLFWAWFFEVDKAGRVYQLKPDTMERDGILSKDGWNESAKAGKVTPYNKDSH